MKNKFLPAFVAVLIIPLVTGCISTIAKRDLTSYSGKNTTCYDRQTEPYTPVVDSHIHFRPFGGAAVPFSELNEYFNKTGVLFVNIYGIGQILPVDSSCTYYLDCPGTPALPSIKNDFTNASNYLEFGNETPRMVLSMTFPDMANPETIVELVSLYDKEYPNMFKWAGEVNLIKQALLGNDHEPATKEDIEKWAEFMSLLKDRNIPINIHSDLGNTAEPTKYLPLMEYVLELYPDNKIIWAHMGLSKELPEMDPTKHIQIMKSLLDKSPNLMLDISWRVLEDNYFSKYRELYAAFLNNYSDRILPGTDFVASRQKDFETYKNELTVNSEIHKHLNNEAFRNIVLGNNYFRLLGLNYNAPQICN
ncbi:MAG: amidohydrolase family protein [Candidatus Marithrix sp.]